MNRKNKPRRSLRPGARRRILFTLFLFVGALWPADAVRRYRQVQKQPADNEAILVEGTFADASNLSLDAGMQHALTPPYSLNFSEEDPAEQETESLFIPKGYVPFQVEYSAIHNGMLLRLDSSHAFTGIRDNSLTDFSEKNDSYSVKDAFEIQEDVVPALNRLASAYQTVTGTEEGLMVYSTTKIPENSLYPEELPDSITGYCVDICIQNPDGTLSVLTQPDPWLSANAWNYGFVFSYTESEVPVTGISPAPYHLRYVGKVHAALMHEYGLTFSAYLAELKQHTISNPYYYTDGNVTYTVFYIPVQDGAATFPVPRSGEYVLSGNNTDGLILTATDEKE